MHLPRKAVEALDQRATALVRLVARWRPSSLQILGQTTDTRFIALANILNVRGGDSQMFIVNTLGRIEQRQGFCNFTRAAFAP